MGLPSLRVQWLSPCQGPHSGGTSTWGRSSKVTPRHSFHVAKTSENPNGGTAFEITSFAIEKSTQHIFFSNAGKDAFSG